MIEINLYNQNGEIVGKEILAEEIFGLKPNISLIHQVLVGIQANRRIPYAHTKTRGDVRGGGKKPWAQKGTGRSRQGSSRSPIWVGGGVTFGPRSNRNFHLKVNKKMKKQALRMALSDKVKENTFLLVNDLNLEAPKTKLFLKILSHLPMKSKKILIVINETKSLILQASKNISRVRVVHVGSLSLEDVLYTDNVVLTLNALSVFTKTYSKK